eukprot:GHVU01199299.1.p2 GENE.GHVU01199299.1~~GHVU01199299.1.p2  ORF type:complete len:150 (-),score=31.64 GHVU01199299.1:600-1049(-)
MSAGDRMMADWRGENFVQDNDDVPSSASSDELFSDEVNVLESDEEINSVEDERELVYGKQPINSVEDEQELVYGKQPINSVEDERELVYGKQPLPEEKDSTEKARMTELAGELQELARDLVFGDDNTVQDEPQPQNALDDSAVIGNNHD